MTITDEELEKTAKQAYFDSCEDAYVAGYRACEERMKADLPKCINCNGPLNFIASEICSNCDIEPGI